MPDTTKQFQVFTNGMGMGPYEGQNEDDALDAYARDVGFDGLDALLEEVPDASRDELDVEEV